MLVVSVQKETHQQTDSTANLLSIHFSKFHTVPGETQKLRALDYGIKLYMQISCNSSVGTLYKILLYKIQYASTFFSYLLAIQKIHFISLACTRKWTFIHTANCTWNVNQNVLLKTKLYRSWHFWANNPPPLSRKQYFKSVFFYCWILKCVLCK